MNRERAYHRYQRIRVICRKKKILLSYGGKANLDAWTHGGQTGRLSKGKIHCSCPICSQKSFEVPTHRDVIQQTDANEQLRQFNEDY